MRFSVKWLGFEFLFLIKNKWSPVTTKNGAVLKSLMSKKKLNNQLI